MNRFFAHAITALIPIKGIRKRIRRKLQNNKNILDKICVLCDDNTHIEIIAR